AGADDYLQGPLTPERLVERIRLYRSGTGLGGPSPRLAHGDLVVDLAARQVRWHGRIIALRPNEFSLLAHFVAHPDRVFSRSALIANLGKDGLAIDERTVDVWIGRLRRGLRAQGVPDPLRTVRSMGYVLDGLPAEAWREAG
ncbi:MAG: response regulator transcription factor, partial [Novosphingobium sp.]